MLVGDRPQTKPVGGEVVTESCIVPGNPCRPVIVIAEVPVAPARTETLVGLATRAKSWTEYETDTE
jgi:hypothetical protein